MEIFFILIRKAQAPVLRRIDWSTSTEIKETRRGDSLSVLTYRREMGEIYTSLELDTIQDYMHSYLLKKPSTIFFD